MSAFYTWRFIQAIFLGPPKTAHGGLTEAPVALWIPQYLLIMGILVMSFSEALIEPISQAIDPQFASTLVWQGMSLEMIYGYWNPAGHGVRRDRFAIVFGLFWLMRRAGWLRASSTSPDAGHGVVPVGLPDFFKTVFATLTPPFATAFWGGLATATTTLAQRTQLIYTGNGQTYNLYITVSPSSPCCGGRWHSLFMAKWLVLPRDGCATLSESTRLNAAASAAMTPCLVLSLR